VKRAEGVLVIPEATSLQRRTGPTRSFVWPRPLPNLTKSADE
jgi:hypothetical protein